MNLVLLLPAALAALAALTLPLLVHLARRQQQRPTVFAALRWLRAQPRPRRRVRFDEWWLLAVRLLLVALLALLLARPALLGVEDAGPRLLVMPGVDEAAVRQARAQADDGVDARWLAPGFPTLDTPAPAGASASASLLREFDAGLPAAAPLQVLVPEALDGADAARLRLVRPVDWQVVGGGSLQDEPARIAPPVVAIRHDAAHREDVRFLRAAVQAWHEGEVSLDVDASEEDPAPVPPDTHVLAWLRADPLPAAIVDWIGQGGQVLLSADATRPAKTSTAAIAWRDDAGAPLLTASSLGAGRVLQFVHPLQPAAMPALVEPAFAARLRELLQPPVAPTRVAALDYAPDTGAIATPAPARELHAWLALAIALLALLERWLATSGRRRAAA
ncbi:BatA domain-containing protein [Luteimonas kalidii]|uniref:BatA domain-containing protein n=1 Tax=Luteimonas kalidii TaxID=3042025 RepID=A0ABT6JPG1_9GAMM|nr:BatA domain-containing protein [Luteimonas kalidii]MDH5832563.1 BatA domain-containing protein [Luteimonas kalidii]